MIEIFCVVVKLTVVYALNISCQFPMLVLKGRSNKLCHSFYINQRNSIPTWSRWVTIFKARSARALRVQVYSGEYFHRTKIHEDDKK